MKKLLLFAAFVFVAMTMNAQTAVTCAEAAAAMPAQSGSETDEVYIVTGYVTNTNGAISPSRTDASIDQQTFWMDDIQGTTKTFQGYWCNLPGHEALNVGDKITLTGKIVNYNNTPEIKNGDVVILERASVIIDTIPATACEAIAEGSALSNFDYSTDAFAVTGRLSTQDNVNNYGQHTFDLVCADNGTVFGAYNCTCAESITLGIGDSVRIIGKLYNYNGKIEISNGTIELIEKNMRPTTAPATPTHAEADVMALYCNHYTYNNLNFEAQNWGTTWQTLTINGMNIASCTSMTWDALTSWNAEYYDVSAYEKLHADIWVPADAQIKITFEAQNPNYGGSGYKGGLVFDLQAGWNAIDANLSDWPEGYVFEDIKYLIFEGYREADGETSAEGKPFAFSNIYFWQKTDAALFDFSYENNWLNIAPANAIDSYLVFVESKTSYEADGRGADYSQATLNSETDMAIGYINNANLTATLTYTGNSKINPKDQIEIFNETAVVGEEYVFFVCHIANGARTSDAEYFIITFAGEPAEYENGVVYLADVANYIDFQALSESDPAMTSHIVTSTDPYELANGSRLVGFVKADGAEAENKWNVKSTYNFTLPTPTWEGVDSLKVGTMFRAASGTTIELGAFTTTYNSQLVVFYQPNGDAERGVEISVYGEPVAGTNLTGVGTKIDGIRPAYAGYIDLPAGNYDAGDIVIKMVINTSNIFGVAITAFKEHSYQITTNVSPDNSGHINYVYNTKTNATLNAIPNYGYHFAQWSDGVTENPRTIALTKDTTITAEFVQDLYPNVKIGDLYYDLNFDDKTAIVLGSSSGATAVSVTDNSIAEWNELPQEYVFEANCPTDAAYLGLKSVKVYADQDYINILVEPDMNELPDLVWVPFQVFIDADNSDATGGYGDLFTDANTDILLEGAVFAEGQPYSYNPAVYKWWGEVGGYGWVWTDRSVEHDGSDYWGAIIGEGQLPVGNSQYIDGKFEIQLSRELLATAHPMNDTEFGIGFSIMQNWSSVGILPIASPTVDNPSGYVAKLKVRINKNAIPAETSELELNPNLVIPSSVTYNDENYTVTTITSEAFKNHTEITSVEIPTSMTYIAYDAFEGCDSITSVVWNAKDCNGYRFGSQVESFVFGNEVEVIPSDLCSGMYRLTSINIPNSVRSISSYAFFGCNGLTSIVVPDGVTRIGYEAFANCSNLTHLYIPATVEEIGEHNLLWDMQLTHLTAPASVFAGYEGYDYYDINYYVTRYLAEYAPYHSHQLDTLIINHGELDAYSYGIIALCNKTMRHMDLSAVENTELQDEAFAHFYNLRSLVLPQGLEKINYMAIANCKSLESITIPASVTEIGMSAFENCYLLESVNFAQGSMLNTIGVAAFYNCHELQSIAIPEGVTEIGKLAFYDCTYLNDVIVPASVQAIGDNAFALCARMQQMRVKAVVPPSIANKTFEQVSREMPVYVPMNSVNAYKADPLWGEMNIIGVDEQWDAVDNITTSTVITKQLINGQLYIFRDGKTYTAQGQEVK